MEQDTGESSDRSDIPGLVMEVEYDTDVEGEDNDAKMGEVEQNIEQQSSQGKHQEPEYDADEESANEDVKMDQTTQEEPEIEWENLPVLTFEPGCSKQTHPTHTRATKKGKKMGHRAEIKWEPLPMLTLEPGCSNQSHPANKGGLRILFSKTILQGVGRDLDSFAETELGPRSSKHSLDSKKSWEHKDPAQYTLDDLEEVFNHENEENPHQEPLDEYGAGGYVPIQIDEDIGSNRKYKVVRKLGFGHFSTVWLCHNNNQSKYDAVKIVKSENQYTLTADDEIKLLRTTATRNPEHPGYKFILQMIDSFSMISENGVHRCLVFEFMGPSLFSLLSQSGFQGIQEDAVKNITKQVLQGLMYLHEECKIIHTDIKPENILICAKENHANRLAETVKSFRDFNIPLPASYLTSKAYEEQFTVFDKQNKLAARRNSIPRSKLPNESEAEKIHFCRFRKRKSKGPLWVDPNIQIKIADLGNGCYDNHHYAAQIQTLQYRALEVIIEAGYSFPADIWSVGCTIYELVTGEYLFNPQNFSDLSIEEDHLGLIWELLDGIPSYIARNGRRSDLFFDNDGNLLQIKTDKLKIWKVEDILVDKYNWKRVKAIPFGIFIEALVEPDPELRATASDALKHMWLNENFD